MSPIHHQWNTKSGFILVVILVSILISVFVISQFKAKESIVGASQLSLESIAQAQAVAPLAKIKTGDPLPANLFIEMAKIVNPAIVNIYTTYLPKNRFQSPRGPHRDPFFDLFEQFMGPGGGGGFEQRPAQSLGTGFIIREDGLVITNNHVIDKADVIKVQLDERSKESFDGRVIGKDPRTDIALVKIETKRKLPTLKLGTSADLQVGEWVAAFGNPFGHGHTMTKGIISAIGREIDEINNMLPFIQTDASINPGNSGGPLVNTQGLVIGVNTAIDPRAQGIGFAIPIDNVKDILGSLEKDGGVKRGFIGVLMADIDDEQAASLQLKQSEGALVTQIVPKSPADLAGLEPYDLVIEFNGQKVSSTKDLSRSVVSTPVGREVGIKVLRNSKTVNLKIKVGTNPEEFAQNSPRAPKKYDGQKAPFDFGFKIADYSNTLAQEFGIVPLNTPRPIVIEVGPKSPAAKSGLAPGDVILDVNRVATPQARAVLKLLKPEGNNVLRVLRGTRVVLITLRR